MRAGGGKAKGSAFERQICKDLSKWVSRGMRSDLFWRSAMSGGRATVMRRSRDKARYVRQAGDICAVSPEGHALTDEYYIECKNYKDIRLLAFLMDDEGPVAKWWGTAKRGARDHGLEPLLIVKGNRLPILVITGQGTLDQWATPHIRSGDCDIWLFSEVMAGRY